MPGDTLAGVSYTYPDRGTEKSGITRIGSPSDEARQSGSGSWDSTDWSPAPTRWSS